MVLTRANLAEETISQVSIIAAIATETSKSLAAKPAIQRESFPPCVHGIELRMRLPIFGCFGIKVMGYLAMTLSTRLAAHMDIRDILGQSHPSHRAGRTCQTLRDRAPAQLGQSAKKRRQRMPPSLAGAPSRLRQPDVDGEHRGFFQTSNCAILDYHRLLPHETRLTSSKGHRQPCGGLEIAGSRGLSHRNRMR